MNIVFYSINFSLFSKQITQGVSGDAHIPRIGHPRSFGKDFKNTYCQEHCFISSSFQIPKTKCVLAFTPSVLKRNVRKIPSGLFIYLIFLISPIT